jgi:hypothetical protein
MSTPLLGGPDRKYSEPSLVLGSARALPGVIAGSSLFFALLQSVCTFFAAMEGMRLALGISWLVVSASAAAALDRLHADWIRVPMIVLALLGSLLNLGVLMQVRSLRSRASSQWRQVTPSRQKLRKEKVQFALSIATLVLIGVEEYLHFRWCHHL